MDWDDKELIVQNIPLHNFSPASLQWMFTSNGAGYWSPLTWLSLALDYHLGGLRPSFYHWDSLVIHLLNVALVFLLAHRIFSLSNGSQSPVSWALPAAFLTAIIFGLHPLHVESVAWASERKDVLYGFFYLLSLLAYLNYAEDPTHPRKDWLYCFVFFALSIMSKPMAISLPFVLLLLDFWPLKRWAAERKNLIREKILFLIPLVISAGLAVTSQVQAGAAPGLRQWPLEYRVMNGFHSLFFYIQKTILPFDLSALYSLVLKSSAFSPLNLAALGLVIVVTLTVIVFRGSRPYLFTSWFYYGVALAPVLGIVQVGSHAAADRYTYLSTLSLIMLFSAVAAKGIAHQKLIFALLVLGLSLFLGIRTYHQVGVWKNSVTLWENAVRVSTNPSEISFWNLGFAFRDSGRPDDALAAFDQAIALNPNLARVHYGKGLALSDLGRWMESIVEFQSALTLDPKYVPPHANLSYVFQKLGEYDKAVTEAQTAIQLDPQYAPAYNNLGVSYAYLGKMEEAAKAFQEAASLDPGNPMYRGNLTNALASGNRKQ